MNGSWRARKGTIDYKRWRRTRLEVLEAAGWKCARCSHYGNQIDHIVPLHKGGALYDKDNLQVLCRREHQEKTASERGGVPVQGQAEWREYLQELTTNQT